MLFKVFKGANSMRELLDALGFALLIALPFVIYFWSMTP